MRIHETDHPLLYEINTRLWVRELGRQKKNFTLADIADSVLDEIAALSFDLVWLMGVWQTGEAGRAAARRQDLLAEYRQILPDLTPEDIIGSPYAVQDYRVSDELNGPEALAHLRSRLAKRDVGLILDFVPNHTAVDHPWLSSHPEFYIQGNEESLRREPQNFFLAETIRGKRVIAHGRDPYFPAWTDTAQLNYRHPALRAAMIDELMEIAGQCDGVRSDMSMLLLQEVISRVWAERANPPDGAAAEGEFWAQAIPAVRRRYPQFLFIAEVYWGLEARLQALGFDYTYDKVLYDRIIHDEAQSIREHLAADLDCQSRSVRFLENHDEARAAQTFPPDKYRAAALICYTLPGLRFFHEGQLDGRKVRLPVQLGRRPEEPHDQRVREFYEKLLAELGGEIWRRGRWKQLLPRAAGDGNSSWRQFLLHQWEAQGGSRLVAINFGPQQAQCFASLDLKTLQGQRVLSRDLLSGLSYERDRDSLREPGLYLDMAPYQATLIALNPV